MGASRHKIIIVTFLTLVLAFGCVMTAQKSMPEGQDPAPTSELAETQRQPLLTRDAKIQASQPHEKKPMFRLIAGLDQGPQTMSPEEIKQELNDPWWQGVLSIGERPKSVPLIVEAIRFANGNYLQKSFLVGEGSQIPTSVTPRKSRRNLRYLLTWELPGQGPVLFASARPPGAVGGTPASFLQIIAFDSNKNAFNFYEYLPGKKIWSWAGDSGHARKAETVGQGCFGCHLNGGLNMREMTVPWNSWNSSKVTISPAVVPEAVANDPLFRQLSGADSFENTFKSAMYDYTYDWVVSLIDNGMARNVPELLRRLIATTTVNFEASQIRSESESDITGVPLNFFLNDDALRNIRKIGLSYTVPRLALNRDDYQAFLSDQNFKLVQQRTPQSPVEYQQPGSTFFSFLIPKVAYEDIQAIKTLLAEEVISAKFAAAVLMVDFQNPVFSPKRTSLMTYAQAIPPAPADGETIPKRFAELVEKAAMDQPPCDPAQLSECSAEQQFLYVWNSPDWRADAQQQIQSYLQKVGDRIGTTAGVNDYMTLAVSRRVQFANYPLICNLSEFSLLFPQTNLGEIFYQMTVNGTLATQPSYRCPSDSD